MIWQRRLTITWVPTNESSSYLFLQLSLSFSWQMHLSFSMTDAMTESLHCEQWALLSAALYQHLSPLGMLVHILASHWAKNTQMPRKSFTQWHSAPPTHSRTHTHTRTFACAIAVAGIVADIHRMVVGLVNYVKAVILTHNLLPHVMNFHHIGTCHTGQDPPL